MKSQVKMKKHTDGNHYVDRTDLLSAFSRVSEEMVECENGARQVFKICQGQLARTVREVPEDFSKYQWAMALGKCSKAIGVLWLSGKPFVCVEDLIQLVQSATSRGTQRIEQALPDALTYWLDASRDLAASLQDMIDQFAQSER